MVGCGVGSEERHVVSPGSSTSGAWSDWIVSSSLIWESAMAENELKEVTIGRYRRRREAAELNSSDLLLRPIVPLLVDSDNVRLVPRAVLAGCRILRCYRALRP